MWLSFAKYFIVDTLKGVIIQRDLGFYNTPQIQQYSARNIELGRVVGTKLAPVLARAVVRNPGKSPSNFDP